MQRVGAVSSGLDASFSVVSPIPISVVGNAFMSEFDGVPDESSPQAGASASGSSQRRANTYFIGFLNVLGCTNVPILNLKVL